MKNKLKTLKDLKPFDEEGNIYSDIFEGKMLRKEAIKWVKDMERDLQKYAHLQGKPAPEKDIHKVVGLIATQTWIINFFNISKDKNKSKEAGKNDILPYPKG